jgi:3-oxoacyl-[acyl-carrier protein] reductase
VNLRDLHAIVTGGGSGMGRTFALELARAGAHVLITDVATEPMAEVVASAAELPGTLLSYRCDVSNEDDVIRMVHHAHEVLGGLDALINNAGIIRDGHLVRRKRPSGLKKLSLEDWNRVLAVDLTGPFLCTREFAAKMIETETPASVVVNISSIARHGNPGQSNYSAAKAGLVADTKLWALELARHGVRVGAVAPGAVNTPMIASMPPVAAERIARKIPLGRMAEPHEIWLAVKFVLECDYFTGRCIDVDGGLSV